MSKTKSSGLSHYELLFIIPNKFTEGEANEVSEKTKDLIVKNQGQVTYTEFWGKKQLTYPIKQNEYGYYSLIEFDLPGINLEKVNKELRMSDEIIRHQIVVKKIRTEKQIAFDKRIAEKIAAKNIQKEKAEEEKESAEVEKPKDKKLDLKDLDEKLDNILDTKDLL